VPLAIGLAPGGVVLYQQLHEPVARDVESEPNNSAAQANWIASERTIRGHIGQRLSAEESDRDFYQLTVDKGTHVLRVELTGIPTMDLKLEVFDALGRRLAETDTGGVGDGEIIPNARLEPGEYYIAVREVWVSGRPATEDETNWYTLTASWHPLAPNHESEPDDSPAQAVPLPLDQPMHGYLGRANDVDYFYPRGEGGGTLSGLLSGIEGVDTRVVVLPPGSTSGPPGALPPGARVFDSGGPGGRCSTRPARRAAPPERCRRARACSIPAGRGCPSRSTASPGRRDRRGPSSSSSARTSPPIRRGAGRRWSGSTCRMR
jgi:hypothetical protein